MENVRIVERYNKKPQTDLAGGNLYVTTTHLIYAYPESNKETWVSDRRIRSIGLSYYRVIIRVSL